MITDYRNPETYSNYKATGYPVKHKRKVPFDPQVKLGLEYRKIFMNILETDRKLDDVILTAGDYLDLVNDACSSNIHWSVSIEGNPLTHKEVKRISTSFFKDANIIEKKDAHIQEILNHLYSYFAADLFRLPWDADKVRLTHRLLTERTGVGGTPGEFRKTDAVISDPKDGFVYMIPCPEGSIEEEIGSLLDWLRISPYDPVVTAVLFFHEFESIHPFTDGNGRTGRTLFQILLQELGLKNSKLCRFEEEILASLDTYYDLLGYTDQTQDYAPIIGYISSALERAYERATEDFNAKNVLKDLDEASRTLTIRSKAERSWFTISDATKWVSSIREQRIGQKLNSLVELGIMEKEGSTRSTKFRFRDPFVHLKNAVASNNA